LRGAPQNAARKPHAENAYRSKAAPPALVQHFLQNCQKMAVFLQTATENGVWVLCMKYTQLLR
jgi:hypothetical protein